MYYMVDTMPIFLGGEGNTEKERFSNFVSTNLKYPDTQIDCYGTVYIQAIIEIDGSLTDPKIIRGLSCPEFNKEALRVVNLMQTWKPGKKGDKLVRVIYTMPISFELYY